MAQFRTQRYDLISHTYMKTPYCRGKGRKKDGTQTVDHNRILLHAG